MEQCFTGHISPTMINPRVVYKMGDLGENLLARWFLFENHAATRYNYIYRWKDELIVNYSIL